MSKIKYPKFEDRVALDLAARIFARDTSYAREARRLNMCPKILRERLTHRRNGQLSYMDRVQGRGIFDLRSCLRCDRPFESTGNRLCLQCRDFIRDYTVTWDTWGRSA